MTGFSLLRTDVLVVGSGLAGLYAALAAAEHRDVVIATHGRIQESSSWFAQGGVAAALGEDDTVELHEADTLRVGRGLSRRSAVELLVEEAPQHVRRLRELGVAFDEHDGEFDLSLEAGHSRRRVAHAGGGSTGRVIVEGLVRQVLDHPRIQVLNHTTVVELVLDDGRCIGAHTTRGTIVAASTILATGGAASLFERSTNPAGARGQGMALAWRAGAALTDMEFIQFHPTALALAGPGNGFLVSEAVRGEGAHLLNNRGERFMAGAHPDAELAPRDELARAIVAEVERTGHHCVYLTLAHIPAEVVEHRFSSIAATLQSFGLDLASEPIPVAPAAHYVMGGVVTGLDAQTTVPGLLACGEVACTGVHGANRLASNSLMECLVFAARAGRAEASLPVRDPEAAARPAWPLTPVDPAVQHAMWRHAGLVRTGDGLDGLLKSLEAGSHLQESSGLTGRSDTIVARLVATAARMREESRGAHFRADFPDESPQWDRHIVQRREQDPQLCGWEQMGVQ